MPAPCFDELRELCALAGDKASLAIGMIRADDGRDAAAATCMRRRDWHPNNWRCWIRSTILRSPPSPGSVESASWPKQGAEKPSDRWAQATIDWAKGDPAKGNIVVGSPLAVALVLRAMTRWSRGESGWRKDRVRRNGDGGTR